MSKLKASGISNAKSGLEDIDFSGELDFTEPKDNRTPVRRVMDGVYQGAKSTLTDPGKIATTIKTNLPEGYGETLDYVDTISSGLKSTYENAAKEVKPAIRDISKAAKKLVPGGTLEKMFSSLEEWAGGSQSSSGPSQEKIRDDNINLTLEAMFKQQAEKTVEDQGNDRMKAAVDHKRHKDTTGLLSIVAKGVTTLTQYQNTIGIQFQRKSLELQYRQFYIMGDLLQETKKQTAETMSELKAITKNTALPDYVKLSTVESWKQRAGIRFKDKMFGGTKEFFDGVFKNLNSVVMDRAAHMRDKFQNAAQGFDEVNNANETMKSMGGGGLDPAEIGGSVVGSEIGNGVLNKLGLWFRKNYIDKNPSIAAKGIAMRNMWNTLPQRAKAFKEGSQNPYEEYENEPNFFKKFLKKMVFHGVEMGRSLMHVHKPNMSIENDKAEDMLEPGVYTKQANKAQTQIIPGYLAMILRSVESIRYGKDMPLIEYDYNSNGFKKASSVKENWFKKISPQSSDSSTKERFKDYSGSNIKSYGNLPGGVKDALEKVIEEKSASGNVPTPKDLVSIKFYRDHPELAPHAERLSDMYKNHFKMDAEGNTPEALKALSKRAQDDYTNRVTQVGSQANQRQLDSLIDMLDPKGTLTPDERTRLARKIVKDRAKGDGLHHERASLSSTWAKDELTRDMADKTAGLYQDYYQTDKEGKLSDLAKNDIGVQNKHAAMIDAFNRAGTSLHDPRIAIQTIKKMGQGWMLKDMGVLDDRENINFEAIQQYGLDRKYTPDDAHDIAISDVHAKTNVSPVSGKGVLGGLKKLKFFNWKYKDGKGDSGEHMGGMAQDINKNLGEQYAPDGKTVDLTSLNGANMAAIKELDEKVDGQTQQTIQLLQATNIREEVQGILFNTSEMLKQNTMFGSFMLRSLGMKFEGVDMTNIKQMFTSFQSNVKNFKFKDMSIKKTMEMGRGFITRNLRRLQRVIKDDSGDNGLVASVRNLAASIVGVGASGMEGLSDAKEFITNSSPYQAIKKQVNNVKEKAKDWWELDDIYLEGETTPRMTAEEIKQGLFYREIDGVTIYKSKDITDTIRRRIDGKVVLLREDIPKIMFWSQKAKKFVKATFTKGLDLIKQGFERVTGGMSALYQNGIDSYKWAKKQVVNFLNQPVDIYTKDNPRVPVMTALIMANGGYVLASDPTQVVKNLGDIKGAIKNLAGAFVLTEEQLREGIFDMRGNPIRTPWQKLVAAGKGIVKAGFNAAVEGGKRLVRMFQGAKERVSRVFSNIKEAIKGKIDINVGFSRDTALLLEIRDILDARLIRPKKRRFNDKDGDGERDGSKRIKNRNDEKKDTKKKDGETSEKEGGGGLADMLKSVGSMFSSVADSIKKALIVKGAVDVASKTAEAVVIGEAAAGGALAAGAATQAAKKSLLRRAAAPVAKFVMEKSLPWLGRFALQAMPWLGGLATTALAGITSLFTAPVLVTAAVVGATAYGAYKAYKYFTRNNLDDFAQYRYAQYGFSKTNTDYVAMVLNLEKMVADKNITFGKGRATYNERGMDYAAAMDLFDVDSKDKNMAEPWIIWFHKRFKPFFVNTLNKMRQLGDYNIANYDKLDNKQKVWLLENALDEDGPWTELTSPISGLTKLSSSTAEALEIINKVRKELTDDAKGGLKKIENLERLGGPVLGKHLADEERKRQGLEVSSNQKSSWWEKTIGFIADKTHLSTLINFQADVASKLEIFGESIAKSFGFGLSDLEAARFKAYGLTEFPPYLVKNLRLLEEEAAKGLKYGVDSVTWEGSIDAIKESVGKEFGIYAHANFVYKAGDFILWFTKRFLKFYVTYMNFIYVATGKKDLSVGEALLKPKDKYELITKIADMKEAWAVTTSPWEGTALNTQSSVLSAFLGKLRDDASKDKMSDPTNVKKQADLDKATQTAPSNSPPLPVTDKYGNRKTMQDVVNEARQSAGDSTSLSQAASAASAPPPVNGAPDGSMKADGTDYNSTPAVKSLDQVPQPKGKGFEQSKDTIIAAAKLVGVDPNGLLAMIGVESAFDPSANYTAGWSLDQWMNSKGNHPAMGYGQFMPGTWKTMIQKYGSKYGFNANTSPLDGRANAIMAAHYYADNVRDLSGIRPNAKPGDVYMAHFLGSGGASKLFKADPNTIAASLFPDTPKAIGAANRNLPLFYANYKTKGKTNPRTAQQLIDLMSGKLVSQAKAHGFQIDAGATSTAGSMRSGGTAPTMGFKDTVSSAGATTPITPTTAKADTSPTGVTSPITTGNVTTPSSGDDVTSSKSNTQKPTVLSMEKKPPVVQQPAQDMRSDMRTAMSGSDGLLSKILEVEISSGQKLQAIIDILSKNSTNGKDSGSPQPQEKMAQPRKLADSAVSFYS